MEKPLAVAIAAAIEASKQYDEVELPEGSIVVIELRNDKYEIIDFSSCQIGQRS